MARQIIVLDVTQANQGQKLVKAVFWFAITQAKAYQKPTFQSAVDDTLAGVNKVTTPEISDLRAGLVGPDAQAFIGGLHVVGALGRELARVPLGVGDGAFPLAGQADAARGGHDADGDEPLRLRRQG